MGFGGVSWTGRREMGLGECPAYYTTYVFSLHFPAISFFDVKLNALEPSQSCGSTNVDARGPYWHAAFGHVCFPQSKRARPCSSFTSAASQHLCAVHTSPPLRGTALTLSLLTLPSLILSTGRCRFLRGHGHGNHPLLGRGCLSWAVHGGM